MAESKAADGSAAGRQVADALARYYDLDLEDDQGDLEMYLALAQAGDGQILELMAGSGRIAVPLAAAGYEVTAVDRDAAMLRRAATRWESVKDRAAKTGKLELVSADVTTFSTDRRYDLVIVALNSLLLLDGRGAQQKLFSTVAAHIAPNGQAVIDVWLPTPEDLALYDGRVTLDWLKRDDATGGTDEWVAKQTSARYEGAARRATITSFFDAWHNGQQPRRTARTDTINFRSADELEWLARESGLTIATFADDYEMGQFAADSDRLVMVCRAVSD